MDLLLLNSWIRLGSYLRWSRLESLSAGPGRRSAQSAERFGMWKRGQSFLRDAATSFRSFFAERAEVQAGG